MNRLLGALAAAVIATAAGCAPAPPDPRVDAYNGHVDAINRCLHDAGWETETAVDAHGLAYIEILVDETEPGARSTEVDQAWDRCAQPLENPMAALAHAVTAATPNG